VLRLNRITFACDDPQRLAEFWAQVLDGYEVEADGDGWRAAGEGAQLFFHRMSKSPTIEVPIHLDVNVPDREADLQRLLGLGARLVETKSHQVGELSETWTVMRDPEGNGFCIQSPPDTSSRYIGNVTFACADPTALGRFWAEALGWPEEEVDEAFLQKLRDGGIDERELTGFYVTRPPGGGRPRFLFQRREKSRPDSYPLHLDLHADDREAEIARLLDLGAAEFQTQTSEDRMWTIMRDPEGNPFCVD
jgi:catechol 2,3-dioxygenase-like lactoylglutathione lyase family enzyme